MDLQNSPEETELIMKSPCNPEFKGTILHWVTWGCKVGMAHETGVKMGVRDKKPCPLNLDIDEHIHV